MSRTVEAIEVKLLLSANRKPYMRRRLAQQRVTLSNLERSFHASRAISAVAELLVFFEIVGIVAQVVSTLLHDGRHDHSLPGFRPQYNRPFA